MELGRELRVPLIESLARHLGDSPFTVTRVLLGASVMRYAPGGGANAYRYAQWIVGYVLVQSTPLGFIKLVEDISDPALVEVHTFVEELKADQSKWTAAGAHKLWAPEGWPFIDRAPVRQSLADMAAGSAPAALAVEGPLGHGKRTIGSYIRMLARETAAFEPAIVELRREPQGGLLEKMVFELSMAMGIEADVRSTHKEPDSQASAFANQIAYRAMSAPASAWFVPIVVDDEGLEEGVLTFVDSLLGVLDSTPELSETLRVLVFCEDLSELGLQNPPALECRHTLTQVTDAEIREWLEAAAPGKKPTVYELAANSVMETVRSAARSDSNRLRLLSNRCAVALRELAGAPDA